MTKKDELRATGVKASLLFGNDLLHGDEGKRQIRLPSVQVGASFDAYLPK